MLSRRVLRIKALQYLFAFFKQDMVVELLVADNRLETAHMLKHKRESLDHLNSSLDQELAKINNFFIDFLQLLIEWQRIDKENASGLVKPVIMPSWVKFITKYN